MRSPASGPRVAVTTVRCASPPPTPRARKLRQAAGDTLADTGDLLQRIDSSGVEQIAHIRFQRGDSVCRAAICGNSKGIIVLMSKQRRSFAQPLCGCFVELRWA